MKNRDRIREARGWSSPADKAKRTLLAIEIPRDELALRMAEAAMGMKRPPMVSPSAALDDMDRVPGAVPGVGMGEGFRRAADAAVAYFHECLNAGREPS